MTWAGRVRRIDELDAVDALVLPGGESTVMDKLLRKVGLHEPLRRRIADGLPVLGTCAGMILLADTIEDGTSDQQTLGGLDLVVRRNAFGRQVDSFEADLDIAWDRAGPLAPADLSQRPFRAVFIRAPWVDRLGPQVRVIAQVQDTDGRSHPVAVRQGRLMATAFHPELTGDDRIHRAFVRLAATGLADASADISSANTSPAAT